MSPRRAVVAAVPVALLLAGCGDDGASGAAASDGPTVVTALYPLAFVAERVGGDDVTLVSLAAPGVEPHDLELAPQQVGSIANAGLVLYLYGFAPAVDEAVEQNAPDRALDVGTVITLLEAAADGAHADEGDDGGDEHGSFDPHFWLDPTLLADVAHSLADRLAALDPDHGDAYAERADALADDLDDLDRALETGLADCDIRTIVTAHAAFGYLTERYGFEQLSVAGLEPDAEPSASRVAEVQSMIRADGVTTVYVEPGAGDVVGSIAADLDLDVTALNPIEFLDGAGGEDYLSAMATNLAVLRAGQACA